MEDLLLKFALLFQASAIGLGVGSSTIAIAGFLTALFDAKIDEGERRILGVVYVTLRVAMVSILITTALVQVLAPEIFGAFAKYLWVLIGVLYLNAILMTKHWISPKYGPAIQAGTWYTLGFMVTIHMFELFDIRWMEFAVLYAGDILLAYITVNGYLAWRKRSQVAKGVTS